MTGEEVPFPLSTWQQTMLFFFRKLQDYYSAFAYVDWNLFPCTNVQSKSAYKEAVQTGRKYKHH